MKKKWIFIIIFIAIIGVVLTIVFINLFKEKDTKQLSENLNSVVENGYLSAESEEYDTIEKYLTKVLSIVKNQEELSEINNSLYSYKSYAITGEFLNRQIVFTKYTQTYKKNRKSVEDNLKKAQNSANLLKKYIDENMELTDGSEYWLANTWQNCKQDMKNIMLYTGKALNGLQKIYIDSIDSKAINNDLTQIVFESFQDLNNQTIENLTTKNDCGTNIYNFVNIYLTTNGEHQFLNYVYSQPMQTKIADIKKEGKNSVYYGDLLEGRLAE